FEASAGYHPYVEFGNRLLGALVGVGAVLAVGAVWRWAGRRRDLWWPALTVLAGTGLQGLLGGITVRTGLHPTTVMAHFLLSMVLVALSPLLLHRAAGPRPRLPRAWTVPP